MGGYVYHIRQETSYEKKSNLHCLPVLVHRGHRLSTEVQLDLQMRTDAFGGISFTVPGNLSYMAIGLLLMVEGLFAERGGIRTRVTGRLLAVLFLAWEIFKLPVLNKFSLLNEWGYIFSCQHHCGVFLFPEHLGDPFRYNQKGKSWLRSGKPRMNLWCRHHNEDRAPQSTRSSVFAGKVAKQAFIFWFGYPDSLSD